MGYGQLIWRLQNDVRVDVHDRTNVRSLTSDQIGGPVDLVVADLSFISLSLVLPALADCVEPDGDLLPMVKPQFQVGKDRVGAGGWSVTRTTHRSGGRGGPRRRRAGARNPGCCGQPTARARG